MKTEFIPVEWSPTCIRCGGYAYEYSHSKRVHEKGKRSETISIIQCVWCLQTTTSKWHPNVKDQKRSDKIFLFDSGRFSGRTVAQVGDTEDGIAYLNLIASGDLRTTEECLHAVNEFLK